MYLMKYLCFIGREYDRYRRRATPPILFRAGVIRPLSTYSRSFFLLVTTSPGRSQIVKITAVRNLVAYTPQVGDKVSVDESNM